MTNDEAVAACKQSIIRKPIIAATLRELKERLPGSLRYHVASHTDDVIHEALLFALTDALSEREVELLAIAAAFHDIGFIEKPSENEAIGADRARQAMIEHGYSPQDVEEVVSMILATQLIFQEDGPRQIPSTPLSRYLLDADVSNLGREDFFEKADLVRQELNIEDKIQFFLGVTKFLAAHCWYTPAAKKLRGEKKEENIVLLRQLNERSAAQSS